MTTQRLTNSRHPAMSAGFIVTAIAAIAVAILVSTATTRTASAEAIWPWTEIGTTGLDSGQNFSAVDTLDQSGTADNWDRYIEFVPDYSVNAHRSAIEMKPEPGPGNDMAISLNYRGPTGDWSSWEMLLIDEANPDRPWVSVWDNSDMPSWVWTTAEVQVPNMDRFLNERGNVVVIWRSTQAIDATQLDYLSVRRSGTTPVTPTTPPTQPPVPPTPPQPDIKLPPFGGDFDYQIGEIYTPAPNVSIVSRDWYAGWAAPGIYNICYVNAFQTQPDDGGDRIDLGSNWPQGAVSPLYDIDWGEYVIDLTTAELRQRAANHVFAMIDGCADKGFDAVEFDNLDVWTRLGTRSVDAARQYQQYWFGQAETEAYAKLLVDYTHDRGLAAAQKNTVELSNDGGHERIGFDFVIAESCQKYDECWQYANSHGDRVIAIEYTWENFNAACDAYGSRFPVVKEDDNVVYVNSVDSFC